MASPSDPPSSITAVFHYLRCSRTDFAVMFAALWLISDIGIAFISPYAAAAFS
ncbi:hypothetical protein [Bradyrhizobium sp. 2]|uniref:hypothetical protein n=1 Tax=Bradyrhizobium sp. 2 TaxID=190045 RepID=UPI001FFBE26E|nr:hypothetical protein [Bradyrhizobium sp. 2]